MTTPSQTLERRRVYRQRNHKKNPLKVWLETLRRRAKGKGLDFNLTVEDLIVPEKCPVLGIPLRAPRADSRACDSSPSVDRLDNEQGYVSGNVRVISYRANLLKKDATLSELIQLALYVAKEKGNE